MRTESPEGIREDRGWKQQRWLCLRGQRRGRGRVHISPVHTWKHHFTECLRYLCELRASAVREHCSRRCDCLTYSWRSFVPAPRSAAVRKESLLLFRSMQLTELTAIAAFVEQRGISSLWAPRRVGAQSTLDVVCCWHQVLSQRHPEPKRRNHYFDFPIVN